MCQLDKYVKNETGSIAKCNKCGSIQIQYGNFIMTMKDESFDNVVKMINRMSLKYTKQMVNDDRVIAINTQAEGLFLALNVNELNDFASLLQEAKFIMDVEVMSFDNNTAT